jgi:hypothetical protein
MEKLTICELKKLDGRWRWCSDIPSTSDDSSVIVLQYSSGSTTSLHPLSQLQPIANARNESAGDFLADSNETQDSNHSSESKSKNAAPQCVGGEHALRQVEKWDVSRNRKIVLEFRYESHTRTGMRVRCQYVVCM